MSRPPLALVLPRPCRRLSLALAGLAGCGSIPTAEPYPRRVRPGALT